MIIRAIVVALALGITTCAAAKQPLTGWCHGQYAKLAEKYGKAVKMPSRHAPPKASVPMERVEPGGGLPSVVVPGSWKRKRSGTALQLAVEPSWRSGTLDLVANVRSPSVTLGEQPAGKVLAPEKWLKAVLGRNAGLYAPRGFPVVRSTTLGGRKVTELCALYRYSPGHATTRDGNHFPLPYENDLVQVFFWERKGKHFWVAMRLPQGEVPGWLPFMEQMLKSLKGI